MLLRVDKYFIEELNKNGYNIDFKTLTGIYRDSRNNPDVIRKKIGVGYNEQKKYKR